MADKKSDAEEIFRKSEQDMSDLERMMANIMAENNEKPAENPVKILDEELSSEAPAGIKIEFAEETPASQTVQPPKAPVPPVKKERPTVQKKKTNESAVKKEGGLPDRVPVNSASKASFPEMEKEASKNKKSVSDARKTNIEREKKIAKTVKKKSGKPAAVILVLCGIMLIGAFVFHKTMQSIYGGSDESEAGVEQLSYDPNETDNPAYYIEVPDDIVLPEPDPEESEDTAETEEASEEENVPISIIGTDDVSEDNYTIYVEDLSWTEAQEKCYSMGGYLAVISNQEEFDEITSLAEQQGIEKLWIGCHRENGELVWENYETTDFYKWGKGEPSEYDSGDNVAEDYLLLWKFNGEWVYNDSRNDPVSDYPGMYSGQIGYVFESY